MGLSFGSSQVIPSKWKSQRAPRLSFDTIHILLSDVVPLGRSEVCAVEGRLLGRPVHANSNHS